MGICSHSSFLHVIIKANRTTELKSFTFAVGQLRTPMSRAYWYFFRVSALADSTVGDTMCKRVNVSLVMFSEKEITQEICYK